MPSIRELLRHKEAKKPTSEYSPLSGLQLNDVESRCEELILKADFNADDFNIFVIGLGELLGGTQQGDEKKYIRKQSRYLVDYENDAYINFQLDQTFDRKRGNVINGTVMVSHDKVLHFLSQSDYGNTLDHRIRIVSLPRVAFENYVTESIDEVVRTPESIGEYRRLNPQVVQPFASRLLELYRRKNVADI